MMASWLQIVLIGATDARDPLWLWLAVLGGLVAFAWLLSWINAWEKRRGKRPMHAMATRAGTAMLELQGLFMKAPRNVIEAKHKQRKRDDGQGAPPQP